MTINQILNYIDTSIKTSFANALLVIKKHTFKVQFPDIQKVRVQFPQIQRIAGKVELDFPKVQKVTVENKTDQSYLFKSIVDKLEETKTVLKDKNITVTNFPVFPTKLEVTNFPEDKELDFSRLEKKLDSLNESIRKLPTKFPDFPKFPDYPEQKAITFPKSFAVENLEGLKSDSPKDYVPVRLTDGKEFYRAIDEFMNTVVKNASYTDVMGRTQQALVDKQRHVVVSVEDRWVLNNTEKIGNTTYIGNEDSSANYQITKVVKSGQTIAMTYATKVNNPTITTFTYAWSHKDTITYNKYSLTV